MNRFALNARIALFGHILNWPWRSHLQRRRVRGKAIAEAVLRYLDKYSGVFAKEPRPLEPDGEAERIFSLWLQGEQSAPPLVRSCWESIRRNCTQPLVVLDENTLGQWVELPDYVLDKWKSGKMRPAHFADIIRLELLYRHGGVWMDSTLFASHPLPDYILQQDFFVLDSGNTLRGSYSFIQNCFIRSRKGSALLAAWRSAVLEYWKEEPSVADYFVHQLIFRKVVEVNPVATELYAAMPHVVQDPTHVLWFGKGAEPYIAPEFERLAAEAPFQKTDYKSPLAKNPPRGSNAWHILHAYEQ